MSVAERRSTTWVMALGAALGASPLHAQATQHLELRKQFFPLVYYQGSTGLTFRAVFRLTAPLPYDRPEPSALDLDASAFAGTQGYRGVDLLFSAPAWVEGWRFRASTRLVRESRFGYYGLGNDTPREGDLVTDTSSHYYQLRRISILARADVQRRIAGPLRALAGVVYRRSEFGPLPGPSLFDDDVARGAVGPEDLKTDALAGRLGLVLDTRDHELDPRRGIESELLVEGDGTFSRVTAHLHGYASVTQRLRLTARIGGERIGGDPPFSEVFWVERASFAAPALGGYYTHRGLRNNRFVDAGKLMASADVKYNLVYLPTLFEVVILGFVDTGRVFPVDEFELTTRGLHWGGGTGLAIKLARNALVAVTAGASADGVTGDLGFGWSY